MRFPGLITSSFLACGACFLPAGQAAAATIQTLGDRSAVASIDRSAEFDPLAANGTPISDYTEGGLFIGVNGDSWVGQGLPLFDPFHGASGPDRTFFFPFGGSDGWVTIQTTDSRKIFGIEFMYGNGWTTGDIYGVPWGNHDAIVVWQTWSGGSMVSSGTIGGGPLLEMGTILGFYDPAGVDQLLVKCTIASSGDPTLQALALDHVHVQLTDCSALGNCSGHGTCVATGTCMCDPNWIGADCSVSSLSAAGRVPDGTGAAPLLVSRHAGNMVTLTWSGSCLASDVDYSVYEGTLGNFAGHQPVSCSTGGGTTMTFLPMAGDRYFLVVPNNGVWEGSYGLTSSSAERPASPGACYPQMIGACP
jgi:hypothetical protein